mmetsp:Transcript_12470/g.18303  ORF Transcript_12470/g.18303 Transcript_12470/m.18303 type:complete len:719 (-) Transcript_12470:289-2445(-)
MRLITVATCQLNQWALDFDGNLERVAESCRLSRAQGATYRLGPELELCGYGCEDHYYELDTIQHCWESLVTLLEQGHSQDLLCDFGMPVLHLGIRYNCRVLCYNGKILLIRPKSSLADDGNYRESRWFTAYNGQNKSNNETFLLPPSVAEALGQYECPFGLGYIQSMDSVRIGCESCEELWTPQAAHIGLSLEGVHIVGNGSGSHHELRKLEKRVSLITSATSKCGGIYLYANQCGCDGGRLYYDGCSMIVVNGQVVCQASQFDVSDVTVLTATVNIDDVETYRSSIPSLGVQLQNTTNATKLLQITCREAHLAVAPMIRKITLPLSEVRYHSPEEECCLGPACWLWDYLRRSGASGFLLPLSGGADSSSVAAIVGVMTSLVYDAMTIQKDAQVAKDVLRICGKQQNDDWVPSSPQELAHYILHTVFMGTDNSSVATKSRAARLSENIGSYHVSLAMDNVVSAMIALFTTVTGRTPSFTIQGGSMTQDLALQNIQARLRMVTAYFFAQLLPWITSGGRGFLLVLGSANVDEALRGYMTKYDCSSADLNPIGAISKTDLKRMLCFLGKKKYPVLEEIAAAPPTAELRPNSGEEDEEHSQLDEEEMGMTYDELSWFGRLRKLSSCGPVTMYLHLCQKWTLSKREIAKKVQRFFHYYSINRHKLCTLTPSYHAEGYSPDDNRFDLRPFLYNFRWTRQFAKMNELVEQAEQEEKDQLKAISE